MAKRKALQKQGNGGWSDEQRLTLKKELGLSVEQFNLLRSYICKDLDINELKFAAYLAKQSGMSLVTKEVIPQVFRNKDGTKTVSMVTTIDALRARADESKKYAPSDRKAEYEVDENGQPTSCTVWIKKFVQGTWHEVPGEAYFDEHKQLKRDGSLKPNWSKMPHVMLRKCAEADALRKAFPKFAKHYVREETIHEEDTRVSETLEALPVEAETITEDDIRKSLLFQLLVGEKGRFPGDPQSANEWIKEQSGKPFDSLTAEDCEELEAQLHRETDLPELPNEQGQLV